MRILLLLYLTALTGNAFAQQHAYERSVQLYKDNKLDSAEYFARKAIRQYTATKRQDSLVFTYVQQALITWDVSNAPAALKVIDTAFRWSKSLPDKHLAKVAAFSRAGQIYNQQQVFDKAEALLKQGLKAIPAGDTINRHVAFLYNNTAILYLMQDEYDLAGPWATRAYQINLKLQGKDGPDMPSILQTSYYISQYSEQYHQALKDGHELQRVMQLHYPPGHRAIGVMHNSLGNIYEALLQYEDALYHRRRAVDIQLYNFKQTKTNAFSLASAYQNLGNLYSYINEDFLAQEYLAKGRLMFEDIYGEDELGMVKILVGAADNKRKLRVFVEAEQLFKQAYVLQQKLDPEDANGLAYVESFYGDLYLDQKNYTQAETFYRLAIRHFKQADAATSRLALQTEKALAEALSARGQHDAAIAICKKLISSFRNIYPKGHDGIAEKMQEVSEIYHRAGQPKQALAWSDSVFIELTGLSADTAWIPALPFSYNTALYIKHRMNLLEGKAVLQLADQYTRYIAGHLYAFRTQATLKNLASVHKQLYGTAIEACWKLSDGGKREDMAAKALGYSEQCKALQLRLAANNLLVDAHADGTDPIATRDRQFRKQIGELNAQYLNDEMATDTVLQQLTTAIEAYRIFQDSLQKSGNTALAAKYRLTPYSLADIRKKLLSLGETMIEYTVTDRFVYMFMVNEKNCTMQQIDRTRVVGIEMLQKMHDYNPEQFAQWAHQLYREIMAPAIPHLDKKRLLIVPDGPLHYLNFELLIPETGAKSFANMPFLIRDYNISYLHSAASAIQFRESHMQRGSDKALLFAPVFTDEMKELYRRKAAAYESAYLYLHRQPFALEAAKKIGRIIPHDLYTEQQAQEKIFKQNASRYNLLHLGTHASVNEDAQLQSRFFFAQAGPEDSSNTEDGYLHVYEIYAMQLRAELAVLTACETGLGEQMDGEGILSLSHSFMYAGCKGVVMSMWKIDEKSSMQVTTDFYHYLSKGYTKSEALRQAKLKLMNTPGGQMAHPLYWAGLTFIGDDAPVYRSKTWIWWLAGGLTLMGAVWFLRRKFSRKSTRN